MTFPPVLITSRKKCDLKKHLTWSHKLNIVWILEVFLWFQTFTFQTLNVRNNMLYPVITDKVYTLTFKRSHGIFHLTFSMPFQLACRFPGSYICHAFSLSKPVTEYRKLLITMLAQGWACIEYSQELWFAPYCDFSWFGISQFYPYPHELLHWH